MKVEDSNFYKVFFSGGALDKELDLPHYWDGKDFFQTFSDHIQTYIKKCNTIESLVSSSFMDTLNEICESVLDIIASSISGYPADAYQKTVNLMNTLLKNLEATHLFLDNKLKERSFYRVTKVKEAKVYKRDRIFHVPFNMRSKMKTFRFSIPGYPGLYLCDNLYLALNETEINSCNEKAIAARFKLSDPKRVRILDLGNRPIDIFNISEGDESLYDDYILLYPLLSACSYIRIDREAHYSQEYMVPQLITQWLRVYNKNNLTGICYFSCKSLLASKIGHNYFFPSSWNPDQDNSIQICLKLNKAFELTSPHYLPEKIDFSELEKDLNNDTDTEHVYNDKALSNKKSQVKYIYISQNTITIPEYNYVDYSNAVRLVFKSPSRLQSIESFSFINCEALEKVNLPDTVKNIGEYAFAECSSLKTVSSLGRITCINRYTFSKCGKLSDITLPSQLTSIGKAAFMQCISLEHIDIPQNVTYLEPSVFWSCKALETVVLSGKIEEIGDHCFWDCPKLKTIKYGGTSIQFQTILAKNDIFDYNSNLVINCSADNKQIEIEKGKIRAII